MQLDFDVIDKVSHLFLAGCRLNKKFPNIVVAIATVHFLSAIADLQSIRDLFFNTGNLFFQLNGIKFLHLLP